MPFGIDLWPFPGVDDVFGLAGDVVGWSWGKVTQGVFSWVAQGMVSMMEWAWQLLDDIAEPRLTAGWFANELMGVMMIISLTITMAMMLISAVQMGWAGRPELFGDTIRNAAKAVWVSTMIVVLTGVGLAMADWMDAMIWAAGREDVVDMFDYTSGGVTSLASGIGLTVLGPLITMLGIVGLMIIVTMLMFRSVMIYLVAGFAPIVLAFSVNQTMRGGTRRLVSLMLALVLAKPAITLSLVVGVKMFNGANDTGVSDPTATLGSMLMAVLVFMIAGFAPMILFKLFPLLSEASVTGGVMASIARPAMTIAQGAVVAGSLGSMATRAAAGSSASGGGGVSSAGGASSTVASALPMPQVPIPTPPTPASETGADTGSSQ